MQGTDKATAMNCGPHLRKSRLLALCLSVIFTSSSIQTSARQLDSLETIQVLPTVPQAISEKDSAQNRHQNISSEDRSNGQRSELHFDVSYYTATAWKWKYVDEQDPKFRALVIDETLDKRLANKVFLSVSEKLLNTDGSSFNSGDPQVDLQNEDSVLANSNYNDEICGQHLNVMLSQIHEMEDVADKRRQGASDAIGLSKRHILLAHVLDSFARYESGQLLGKSHVLGSYDICVRGQLILNKNSADDFTGTRFCWAKLKLDKHLDPTLKLAGKENLLNVGVCLPDTCHSRSFLRHKHLLQRLVDSQFKLPRVMYVEENLELGGLFCVPDSSGFSGLSLTGKLYLATVVCWLVVLAYATIKSNKPIGRKGNATLGRVLDAMSIVASQDDLIRGNRRARGRVELNALNPIKVLGCAFVVLAHAFTILASFPLERLVGWRDIETSPVATGIIVGTFITDTFFVITGLLVTYITMVKLNAANMIEKLGSAKSFTIASLRIIALRYLRLMPMLFLVIWLKKYILIDSGSGPFWDHGFDKETSSGICRTSGAMDYNLAICLPPSWTIASDLIFCAILAPIIVAMTRRPKIALFMLTLLCTISYAGMHYAISIVPEPLALDLANFRSHAVSIAFKYMFYFWVIPPLRWHTAFIGAFAGYALYHYDVTGKLKQWPRWFTKLATPLAMLLIIVNIFITPIAIILKNHSIEQIPIYLYVFNGSLTVGRLTWAIGNAIVFLRMVTDWRDKQWIRSGSGNTWITLSRLNYGILLIHWSVVSDYCQIHLSTLSYSLGELLILFLGGYAFSVILAWPMFVLFENPIDKLIRIFTQPSAVARSKPEDGFATRGNRDEHYSGVDSGQALQVQVSQRIDDTSIQT